MGTWSKLLWFEETICELSSIFNLHKMIAFCGTNGLKNYMPAVKKYRDDLLNKNAYDLTSNEGWYDKYGSDLSKDYGYKRGLYNAIAALMFPLFKENPHLWKIILHIGDIRSWNSLEDLFSHLIVESDESYKESLIKLKLLFKWIRELLQKIVGFKQIKFRRDSTMQERTWHCARCSVIFASGHTIGVKSEKSEGLNI